MPLKSFHMKSTMTTTITGMAISQKLRRAPNAVSMDVDRERWEGGDSQGIAVQVHGPHAMEVHSLVSGGCSQHNRSGRGPSSISLTRSR